MRLDDLSRKEVEELVDQWIHNERNRKIMYRRLIDGVRFDDLSGEFDLSVTQIKNIVYKGRSKILQHIK